MILVQPAMLRVCYALLPLLLAGTYLFGWRVVFLTALVTVCGFAAEAAFTFRQGKPVSMAVFVTCLIFSLSLPPTLPAWMAVIGIVVAVVLGKMAFGGLGQNIFNPAMVGRCFLYVTFPVAMTSQWTEPLGKGIAGLGTWAPAMDAVTKATPLLLQREGIPVPLARIVAGSTAGSIGETASLLILLGGLFIVYRKAAPWRLVLACLAGGLVSALLLYGTGGGSATAAAVAVFSGGFLFGAAFVVTEPITGPKTTQGQWIYGLAIGSLTMIFRKYSNFAEGLMFAVLLMNASVPILDRSLRLLTQRGKRKALA